MHLYWKEMYLPSNFFIKINMIVSNQGRPGGGGVVEYQYTRKKSTKYPRIPQIPPNIPKNNQSFEYFIPEIRS